MSNQSKATPGVATTPEVVSLVIDGLRGVCLFHVDHVGASVDQEIIARAESVLERTAAERDAFKAENAAMQAVVNAASMLEQAINSETQGSEEHYDAQLALCEAVETYRLALTGSHTRGES